MQNELLAQAEKYKRKHKRRRVWQRIVSGLACVVVFCTTYALILPAITMEQTAYCGLEEHKHSEDCYEKQLICGYGASEIEGHTHTDDCYEMCQVLVCSQEETSGHIHNESCIEKEQILVCTENHEHTESCYESRETYICGLTEGEGAHTHGPECYETQSILICDISEYEEAQISGDEEHIHTDDCYESTLVCEKEEHEHSLACYSNPDADLESASVWERSAAGVELTGNWADDVVAFAQTQLGYTESTQNYIVTEEGEMKGITRYGQWYGDPYGDWCAMFVSFCLHYAGIPETAIPYEANCADWLSELSAFGLYQSADGKAPAKGDIVFLDKDRNGSADHVGLVAEVTGDGTGIKAIEGNQADCVQYVSYGSSAPEILGYAAMPVRSDVQTETKVEEGEISQIEISDDLNITEEILLDISDGPAVFIFSDASIPKIDAEGLGDTGILFSARVPRTATDLKEYIETNNGSFAFTLLDGENRELPKDDEGHYLVLPGTEYKLTLGISLPNGIEPGTYQYQLPEGLTVNGGSGTFNLGGKEIGTWAVDENGLITFSFNNNANNYTEVTISATMGMTFSASESPIDFDGKITVIVQKPSEEEKATELSKWGSQGDATEDKPDTSKIYWTVEMLGNKDSSIPGSIITDAIVSGNHTYTESDRENGLTFMASQRDPETGEEMEGGWHKWTVSANDPNLTWTDTGWAYTIPETVTCKYCGALTLGNENWWYWIQYTSTPDETDMTGSLVYKNHVIVDGQETDGWATIKHGQSDAGLIKSGLFQGSENGGVFQWEVTVTIPGRKDGEQAAYFWYLWDAMRVKDAEGNTIGYITNDMNLSEVEVTYNGQTYAVPKLENAGADDLFAWDSTWADDHGDGVYYGRQIDFYHRCDCTEETCQLWRTGYCGSRVSYETDEGEWVNTDFCRCWTVPDDTVFTFLYETDDPAVIEKYGGSGNVLQNEVSLNQKQKDDDTGNSWKNVGIADSEARVPIPGLFKKELTQDYDGYIAKYTITVNEAKLQLTSDGTPLTIHDVMTDTLAYISGSLVITTLDADDQTGTLAYGEDYTVTYDGSGTQTDEVGNTVHVLDIVLLKPEAVQYTLTYDAALIIPTGVTGGVKYSNSASVTLFGKTITSGSDEKVYADINISAKNYQVQIIKTDANTSAALPDATFGLFNENGGQIASGTTDESGKLLFQTNVTQGIILREHTPYYIQELEAPVGYLRDGTKHWFLFCEEETGKCTYESEIEGIQIIPGDQLGTLQIQNTCAAYVLPETGGAGTTLYTTGGLLLITAAAMLLLYNHIKRRKEDSSPS